MEIKVLGPGCPRCETTKKNVEEAVAESGVEAKIDKVTDVMEIAKHGVFGTPAVIVDGKVKSVGKIPTKEEVKSWLKSCLLLMLIEGVFLLALSAGVSSAGEHTRDFSKVPVDGMITMIDLGAKKCIPCKMMAPIMEKMEKEYQDKAAIVFIDVWENREQAGRFGIQAIPTQIFFNPEGKEVFRHVGFMSEKSIVAQLKKMGVE